MTALEVAVQETEPVDHEHSWQLVSVETDCGVEVRERVCTVCSAVLIDG